jgi:hypothetical protein
LEERPASRPAKHAADWKNAVTDQIRLKPILTDSLPAIRPGVEKEEAGSSYNVIIPRDLRKKLEGGGISASLRAGYNQGIRSYRGFFDLLARLSRWISETSYEWSFLFLVVAIFGGMLNRHPLAIISVHVIVVLNVLGLVGGMVALLMVAFRENPVQGMLCLVPPWTAFYMWKNRARYRKTIQRITAPLLVLCLVGVAYAFVPWLNGSHVARGNVRGRIEKAVETIKERLPEKMEKAKGELGELEENVKAKVSERGSK